MLSFNRMWELVEQHPDLEGDDEGPLLGSGEEGQAMEAIRSGLNLRKEGCGSFWDDFNTVCGNADAMSALLDVPKEKITGWAQKVNDLVSEAEGKDSETTGKRQEQVPTGAEPAEDTFGNDANADLRPLPS
ncbi:MAG: hypothetical protein ACXADB_03610 [Candidatus Hermodarchaeia archaeon]|jgi:hypothetical protein